MDRVRERILRATIEHYGGSGQQLKAIEELSELIRALARANDPENIAEEMADVRIMLDQLEIIFGNHDEVKRWEFRKLQRLNRRLKAAEVVE
jgi:NTP pyrophosphatase (non-canonical NTP hydrolase)